MNNKLMFWTVMLTISAASIGTVSYVITEEIEATPMIIQPISVTVDKVSWEMLEEVTDYAIVGKVIDITPVIYTDPEREKEKALNKNPQLIILDKEILSDVKIKVEEDLFGEYTDNYITLRIPGGESESLRQKTIHNHSPQFMKGERVIVFVGNGQSYSISDENFTIMGLDQGTISLDKVGKFATNMAVENNMSEEDIKNKIKSLRRD